MQENVLYSFCSEKFCTDGSGPIAGLIAVKGMLYGVTNGGSGMTPTNKGCCGALFSIDPKTGAETTLYTFCRRSQCADGAYPTGPLLYWNGLIFGTTNYGGSTNCPRGCGTVFTLDMRKGGVATLYTFCQQAGCADGAAPFGGLSVGYGILYGTTKAGGGSANCPGGCGTVYSLGPYNAVEQVLHAFSNGSDGWMPMGGVVAADSHLYGTTNGGGAGNGGVVFAVDPNTNAETVVYSFCQQANCADGEYPSGSLIQIDDVLYGTTQAGGSDNCSVSCGIVFAFDPSSGSEKVLHSFQGGDDGQWPLAGLTAINGTFYGTTWFGGVNHSGTVYSLDPTTNAEQVVYAFCSQAHCTDGERPEATLLNVAGKLYGTTTGGGLRARGTVFELEKAGAATRK
jgi:uncharacterized repeat protein (TIGR03803 family)